MLEGYLETQGATGASRRSLVEALLFLGLLLVYGYFVQPPGANALSRYDLVLGIAEYGTVTIDHTHYNTIDKGFFNGHYYSDKPIGIALFSLPFYLTLRAVAGLIDMWPMNHQFVVYFLNFFVVAIPTALTAVLIHRLVGKLGHPGAPALFAGIVYGLGTMALPFATLYFGHATSAFFGFAAFYAMMKATEGHQGALWSLLAGGLAGAAVLTEYPLIIVVGLLGLYALIQVRPLRNVALFVLGGLPFAAILGLYNYIAFGSPFTLSYEHVYLEQFAAMHEGIFGLTYPSGWVLLELLFSGKGLLVTTPVLALAPLGLVLLWRDRRWRPETILFAEIIGGFLLYNSAYFLPFGGGTPGPRFLVPMLPFAVVAVGIAYGAARRVRWVALPLAAYSIAVMLLATVTNPVVGENPTYAVAEIWLPMLLSGQMVLNVATLRFGIFGVESLLPLAAILAVVLLAVLLVSRRPLPVLPARRLALPFVAPAAALLLLLWPVPLPGVPLRTAAAVPSYDPVVVVESVKALPNPAPGEEGVIVTLESVWGLAPNVGLWLVAHDDWGYVYGSRWVYPFTISPNEKVSFELTWEKPHWWYQGVTTVKAEIKHWSLAYNVGEMEVPMSTIARPETEPDDERLGLTGVGSVGIARTE